MKHWNVISFLILLLGGSGFLIQSMFQQAQANGLDLSPADYANGKKRAQAAAKKVSPSLKAALAKNSLKWGAPVFIRAFKEEKTLELWLQETGKKTFKLFRTYPIAAASGKLGPKLREGDRQVPEGFYEVPARMMNPTSRYHLAFNIGYPNAYDRKHGRTGSYIMVHGSNVSIGCLAMTDIKIEEIYSLCAAAHKKGQKKIPVHLFPFRMTKARMKRETGSEWLPFWKNLQTGFTWFEEKKMPPKAFVEGKDYRFSQ